MSSGNEVPGDDIWDELATRFLFTAARPDLESTTALMSIIQDAYWYYLDNIREDHPNLCNYSFKDFSVQLLRHTPGFDVYLPQMALIMKEFSLSKGRTPTCGAIILNPDMTKCLLVRSYDCKSWSFPGGKIARNETYAHCAVREVLEETSLNIRPLLNEEHKIERLFNEQECCMFIVSGVDEGTAFHPQMKGEIGGYGWYEVAQLPDQPQSVKYADASGKRINFFKVAPFVSQLKRWIARQKKKEKRVNKTGRQGSVTDHQVKNGREAVDGSTGVDRIVHSLELLRALQDGNPHKGKKALKRLQESGVGAPLLRSPALGQAASLARGGLAADIERILHDSNSGGSSHENKLLINGSCDAPQEHCESSDLGQSASSGPGAGRVTPSSNVGSPKNGKSINWVPFQFDRAAIMQSLHESVYGESMS